VRLLQGESPEVQVSGAAAVYANAGTPLRASSPYMVSMKREGSVAGLNPVMQIGESLRSAMAGGVSTPPAIPVAGPGYNKSALVRTDLPRLLDNRLLILSRTERKLTTNTSIKLPSPVPISLVHQSTTTHTRSRLSRSTRVQQEEDLDADAEGDEDVEGEDGEDDTTLYCFCHKQSFGDVWMLLIAFDEIPSLPFFSSVDDRVRQRRLSIPMGE